MFKNKIIRYSTVAMIVAILAYFAIETFMPPSDIPGIEPTESLNRETYTRLLQDERAESQNWYRTSDDSPVLNKDGFEGLEFFGIDLSYRVVAKVRPYQGADKVFEVAYTDGTQDTYERYAYLDFELNGTPQTLLLLKHEGVLSLMWRDGTSGTTSYGGGRYLDFTTTDVKHGFIVLDFNKAYNPYCAFNPAYACPLPPAENTLKESIPAGEKYTAEK